MKNLEIRHNLRSFLRPPRWVRQRRRPHLFSVRPRERRPDEGSGAARSTLRAAGHRRSGAFAGGLIGGSSSTSLHGCLLPPHVRRENARAAPLCQEFRRHELVRFPKAIHWTLELRRALSRQHACDAGKLWDGCDGKLWFVSRPWADDGRCRAIQCRPP